MRRTDNTLLTGGLWLICDSGVVVRNPTTAKLTLPVEAGAHQSEGMIDMLVTCLI